MEGSREYNQRDVAYDGEDKSKIHDMRCDVYTRDKQYYRTRECLVFFPHQNMRNIIWDYVKDNIIEEKEDYKAIGFCVCDYK